MHFVSNCLSLSTQCDDTPGGHRLHSRRAYEKPYFLEVKRPGTYQNSEQKDFQKRAEAAGAL
jgi:hypothetical protein